MQPSIRESVTDAVRPPKAKAANRRLARLVRNRSALLGALIVLLFVVIALVGPELTPYDPYRISPGKRLQGPSLQHLMGTDELGRDLFTRVLLGARYSLSISLGSALFGAVIGVAVGIVAGYLRGWLGQLLMRSVDVLVAFPGILLALALVAVLGPGLSNLIIALGLASVPIFARLTYGLTLATAEMEYITAARGLGTRAGRIMLRHLLPNIAPTILVQFSLRVGTVTLLAASLGFIGLGVQPPHPEWGALLANARDYLRTAAHVAIFPGLAIALLVLGLNLLSDGLRDYLDPKLINRS